MVYPEDAKLLRREGGNPTLRADYGGNDDLSATTGTGHEEQPALRRS